jgi:hypothetical protein
METSDIITRPGSKIESKWQEKIGPLLSDSTIHGITQVIKTTNTLLRLTWLTLILSSIAYVSWSTYLELVSYRSYPVVSLYRVNFVNSLDLPIITICNLNPFATQNAKNAVLALKNDSVFDDSISSQVFRYFSAQYYVSSNAWANLNASDKNQFGLSLKKTMLSCVFNFIECDLENDFIEFYDPFYGNCFRYNYDASKRSAFSGI